MAARIILVAISECSTHQRECKRAILFSVFFVEAVVYSILMTYNIFNVVKSIKDIRNREKHPMYYKNLIVNLVLSVLILFLSFYLLSASVESLSETY